MRLTETTVTPVRGREKEEMKINETKEKKRDQHEE